MWIKDTNQHMVDHVKMNSWCTFGNIAHLRTVEKRNFTGKNTLRNFSVPQSL